MHRVILVIIPFLMQELALLYYHRGNRLRGELSEFRIGIQKAREAIDNSIGDSKTMKISVPETLKKNWVLNYFQ